MTSLISYGGLIASLKKRKVKIVTEDTSKKNFLNTESEIVSENASGMISAS